MVADFPVDPEVPQLQTAADSAFMLDAFRQHLKAADPGKTYRIEDCAPFRFRCRQSGSRHVLQYTLRVTDPNTGHSLDQWVTGLLYSDGKTSRRWEEISAQANKSGIPERYLTFDPVAFIPGLQMLVEVFPYDRKLTTLSRVIGGELHDLDPLLLARIGPGEWRIENRIIEPTRYRTEFAAALRYTIRAHDHLSQRSQDTRCYLKVYRKNDRGYEVFRTMKALSEMERGVDRKYSTVEPISYLTELRTLAIAEAKGISLTKTLLTEADPSDELKQAARALAAYNQDRLPLERHQSRADRLAELESASALVMWACPQLRDSVQFIYNAVAAGMNEGGPAPIHGDIKPDHLFLSDGRVTFIDLDWASIGDPLLDPAQLSAYLKGKVGLDSISSERTDTAWATFVEEYFRLVPKSWKRRFPLHSAAAHVEVAAGIFRRQEHSWAEKIAKVISNARDDVSEGTP